MCGDCVSDEIKALRAELDALTESMSPKHLMMAQALVAGKNQTEAYKEAGYKGKSPSTDAAKHLQENPTISHYVELAKKLANLEFLPKKIATFEQKRQMLWDIATRASIIRVTLKEGTAIGGRVSTEDEPLEVFDATAAKTAVSAIAELNKMDGDLAAIKTEGKTTVTYENLPESELDARLAELRRKAGIASA